MRLYIDFSVFTSSEAVGNVHGDLEVTAVPQQGSLVAFDKPRQGISVPQIERFPTHLRVQQILPVATSTTAVSLALEDVILDSVEDARKLMRYMEEGFGLYADEYGKA